MSDPTRPLRVAIDTGPLHGHRTGVGVAVSELVDALERRDDVTLERYVLSFRARAEANEHRLRLPAGLATRIWGLADRPRVDRWVPDVDLLHGTNYVVPPTRRPSLVSVYDCWFLAHPDQAAPAVRRAGAMLRRAVNRGAHVHASSAATAEGVRTHLGTDRVSVVHLGPLTTPPSGGAVPPAGVALGQQLILSIGTLERRKNLTSLVRAFGEIASNRHELRLVLAGADGDDEAALTDAIAALDPNARSHVVRTGAVSADEKAWLLRNAALLAYPSLDEGFGFPVLEAQASSLPVVATSVGSLREIGGDGVAFVDGHEHTDLADRLATVLDDGATRLQLIDAGHRNVKRFSWERTADELAELYRRVVDEARPS